LTPFNDRNGASFVRNIVVFTSKSGAAFSDAMDVFFEPETYINPEIMNLKVNNAIVASQAFDADSARDLEGSRKGITGRRLTWLLWLDCTYFALPVEGRKGHHFGSPEC